MTALEAKGVAVVEPLGARLPLIMAEVTPEQLDAMRASNNYDLYVEDRLARPMLADSAPLIGAPDVGQLGGRRAGQAGASRDTGVDSTHPFLAGRIVAEACFSSRSLAIGARSVCPNGETAQIGQGAARPCNSDGCEHGTHVAGIAAGKGDRFSGIAPDAQIIA